jgi:hypothetical protein
MTKDRHETRRITIEFDYKVNVNMPNTQRSHGRHERTDEEERRFIMDTIRRELKKDGGR